MSQPRIIKVGESHRRGVLIIEELGPLRQNHYHFSIFDHQVVLTDYDELSRATTRHKLKADKLRSYVHNNHRDHPLKEAEVPLPEDVAELALRTYRDRIVVCKWSDRPQKW